MEKRFENYLNGIGIDISRRGHPFADEYLNVKSTNNEMAIKCFEHLLLLLIVDLERIKSHNQADYEQYLKKLNATDTSFWGQRFEISWYSSLIHRLKNPVQNLRRGKEGEEADFVFEYNKGLVSIETTSVTYESSSKMSNPISKLKKAIAEKDGKPYADSDCCLIVDFSNLSFYRKTKKNFSTTISDLIGNMRSSFGAVLFHEAFHIPEEENPRHITQVYDWNNPKCSTALKAFLEENFSITNVQEENKLFFRVS